MIKKHIARAMKLLRPCPEKQLMARSSSLIEVTTALVIISMVFGMAIVIYLNVSKSGFSSQRLACEVMMNSMYNATVRAKQFVSREEDHGEIIIYQEVSSYPDGSDLLLIQLEVRSIEGKLIAVQKHLIYAPENR